MTPLDRISRNIGWQPTDWQRALSRNIPPMAVYGIFSKAQYTPQRRLLTFPYAEQLERARHYQDAVKTCLGVTAMVSAESFT